MKEPDLDTVRDIKIYLHSKICIGTTVHVKEIFINTTVMPFCISFYN